MTKKIRILIADDHTLVRAGLAAFLRICDDFEVVGEAADGGEAIEAAERLKPDVILMDIAMPKLGGLEATIKIKKADPNIKILVLTQYEDQLYVRRFLKAGASGYILKKAVTTDLITAIHAIAAGEMYLHHTVASSIVEGYLGHKGEPSEDPYDRLTDREKEVLKLIAEGYTHKEIAEMLKISVRTAVAHQENICAKLGLHSRFDIVKFAIKQNIVKMDTPTAE
ncbi:MAG TPA: response regulator transcription factor [Nitrospirota bacterium]|nr:response regulator transcription factor [Nitrospirota bacterium]